MEEPVLFDRADILKELAPFCKGVAVKLKGASGQVLCAALLGHGGEVGLKRRVRVVPRILSMYQLVTK
jgi:hypothetical protein